MATRTLIPFDDAVRIVVDTALALRESRPADTRTMSLWEASGYVLAVDVVAERPLPPFDKSMMDGFALRTVDLQDGRTELEVVGEVAAGDEGGTLGAGQAKAIMTGAPLPEGADAVQIVERTTRPEGRPGRVIIEGRVPVGANVTRTGAQALAGEVVVEEGRIIESLTAGVLATVGAAEVEVYRRPRVTVVATGDELVSLDETPGPTQIRDSNRKTLMALAEAEWCRVVDGGIAKDDRAHLKSVIRDGLEGDVLVLSGGVSAGSYDYVRECLEAEGVAILFHQVALKPGKPVLFGRTARSLVFGLPGNPVSTYVTAAMLLTPALRVLGRRPDHRSWVLRLPLTQGELPATGPRTTFYSADLVRLEHRSGRATEETRGDASSARREEGAYREYATDEQRSDAPQIPPFPTESNLFGALAASTGLSLAVRPRPWKGSADHIAFARGNVLIRRDVDAPASHPGDLVSVVMPRSLVDW